MITLKKPDQIQRMKVAGKMLHEVLCGLKERIRPGITTLELDHYAEKTIRAMGAEPTFLNYPGLYTKFPFTICASLDDIVVHGMPNDRPLEEGHILSIDCGLVYKGWQSDSAFTMGIGEIPEAARKLIEVTEDSFWQGIRQAVTGNRLGDVSHAVQEVAEAHGYGVIRDMCGHGIGREMHEDPSVPNYGEPGHGLRLREGMTIAVEPMISAGTYKGYTESDGWTYRTRDHSLCSHYEHTIAITADGPLVLSLPDDAPELKRLATRPGEVNQ